jgi:hypothetical protein
MKIAYCFSGMIRNLDECGPKWKQIIENNPGDIYGHFWDISDKSNDTDTPDRFVELFNPKKIELENYSLFKESTVDIMLQNIIIPQSLWVAIQDSIRDGRFISFHYKIWKANQLTLVDNYDIVVRCRTDCYPDTSIKFEINDMLNIPRGKIYIPDWMNSAGIIDLFAYGNRKIMNYYSCVYLYMMKYLHQGYYCYPYEYILATHLNHKDIKIRELFTDIFSSKHESYNSWAAKCETIYNTHLLQPSEMDSRFRPYIENRLL